MLSNAIQHQYTHSTSTLTIAVVNGGILSCQKGGTEAAYKRYSLEERGHEAITVTTSQSLAQRDTREDPLHNYTESGTLPSSSSKLQLNVVMRK